MMSSRPQWTEFESVVKLERSRSAIVKLVYGDVFESVVKLERSRSDIRQHEFMPLFESVVKLERSRSVASVDSLVS